MSNKRIRKKWAKQGLRWTAVYLAMESHGIGPSAMQKLYRISASGCELVLMDNGKPVIRVRLQKPRCGVRFGPGSAGVLC